MYRFWERTLIVGLLFCLFLDAAAQTLVGKVIDAQTKAPVPFAVVFVSNTSKATETDTLGNFTLKNIFQHIKGGSVEVVVSLVGYTTFRQKMVYSQRDSLWLAVSLVPAQQSIAEVAVKGKRDQTWLKQFKKFEKAFVGTGENARHTKITNAWVVDFEEDGDALMALAKQPIVLENKALGYTIFFELQRGTISSIRSSFAGLARFEEMKLSDPKQQKKVAENRQRAYEGSERHFFKALSQNKLKQEGFVVYEVSPTYREKTTFTHLNPQLGKRLFPFNDTAAVRMGKLPTSRELYIRNEIEILNINQMSRIGTYQDAPFAVSWLRLKGGKAEVTTSGLLFDANSSEWAGDIAERRMADLLPLDFDPEPLAETSNWQLLLPKQEAPLPILSALETPPPPLVSVKHSFEGDSILFRIQVKKTDGTPVKGSVSIAIIEDTQATSADTSLPVMAIADTSTLASAPNTITLEEVKVKVKQNKRATQTLLGKIDYVVESKDLRDIISGNVVTALQSKVPGIDIFETTDNGGFSRKGIRVRGGGYSLRATASTEDEPLFLLDGIPYGTLQSLSAIPVSEVERIEVIKRANPLLGLRGKNGAINVVTKRAVSHSNAPTASVNEGKLFYWQPTTELSKEGETTVRFLLPRGTTYYVTINGLTAENQPFSHEFRVR
ncbi:carboxypeptidase-like regulatory domain-containing protein [Runella limosa]|uniref:carboxypeptidase-like regulatory domain-containing protein n=1 Tax=Runella limosa TaxID=370978 RepID=UPI000A02DCDF|nr:carboxypeptidase-like regulatory domain-containing protein [Runella limosa]